MKTHAKKSRATFFLLMLAPALIATAAENGAPGFEEMVGKAAPRQPRPAPASTFQRAAEQYPASLPTVPVPIPENAPPTLEPRVARNSLSAEQARDFVRDYLAAVQRSDSDDELAFYAPTIDYVANGRVVKRRMAQEARNTQRWPNRAFMLLGEPEVISLEDDEAAVRYRVRYQLSDGSRIRNGEAENTMIIRQTDGGRKIVAIHNNQR